MSEDNNERQAVDLSSLGGFDFAPAWANGKPGDKSGFSRFEERSDRGLRRDEGGPRRDDRGPRRDDRGPRRDDRGPRRDDRGPRRDDRGPRRDDRPPREFVKPLDAEVRILPSQKELGGVIRNMQKTGLAYPLKQIAFFFLDHPEACMLRVTPAKGTDTSFFQCKACGFVAGSEADLISHVLNVHLSDYYDSEEIECEPPKGTFSCVARCGLSGVLLGPPNLHGYDAKVREMVRTRYPSMSEEAYRARIEMVRDADMVEEWRKSCTKKTVYRRKGVKPTAAPEDAGKEAQTDVPAVEREAAELEFRRTIAPGLIANPKSVELTAAAALKCPDRAFVFACRDALAKEKRYPSSLFYALRGAFHYRKLSFFRANDPRGQEFVSSAKPTPLDVEHAIPDLVEIVKYVEANPDVTQPAAVSALAAGDQAKASSIKANLAWLVEKGHLVGYFNGQLALPAENPRFRNIQRKPAKETKPAEPEPAPAPAEPVTAPAEPVTAPAEPAPAPAEPAPAEPAPQE